MLSLVRFREQYTSNIVDHFLWAEHKYFVQLAKTPNIFLVKEWLVQGGKIEQSFPRLLQMTLDNPAIPAGMKPSIRENLDDELGHGIETDSHFFLYRSALDALGISFREYEAAEIYPATQTLLHGLFEGVASHDPIVALSRLTTEELLPPSEFPRIVDALVASGYEGTRDLWEPYFTAHIEGDRTHADDQIENLFSLMDGDESLLRRALAVQDEHLFENLAFYDWLEARTAEAAL
jgi:hypothetical protein